MEHLNKRNVYETIIVIQMNKFHTIELWPRDSQRFHIANVPYWCRHDWEKGIAHACCVDRLRSS
ncbi:hypothetical protein T4D_9868 [Trichinella pseudospiralis]|uniref:Uncharacterized protein n=1 Tax=Trichinella pseudospiralis TaxID=6337 RepID=A0A0V1F9P9_TRIPS|nr:hypothetical protein T4D_9868 [Trichinella pseudospiralis]